MSDKQTDKLYEKILYLSNKRGYFLNPDRETVDDLLGGLLTNENRYGYQSCPCRLSTGRRVDDLDIICPCNYRDQDVREFDACYCGLYVNKQIYIGEQTLGPIPERRKPKNERLKMEYSEAETTKSKINGLLPVWRCTVCGYLCGREEAPEICPICGVSHDRFERFQ